MKKFILIAFLVIFSLSAFTITPDLKSKSENPAVPAKQENKMSDEEINSLTRRVEEIHNRDKSKQTVIVSDGHRSRRGHDGMNRDNRRSGGYVFVGGGAVILLIILIIILV
jgi:hypothetical protein